MVKFIFFIKTNILRIFLLVALSTIIQTGFSQNLNWFNSYQMKLNLGIRVIPLQPTYGLMGGVSFQDSQKKLGLRLGMSYILPRYIIDTTVFIYYFDLTYRLLFIKQKPFIIGLGLEKPSYHINPYHDCRDCFLNNMTLTLQQQIWITNIEIRLATPIGNNNVGWMFQNYYRFSIGINYSFDISRRKSKLNLN